MEITTLFAIIAALLAGIGIGMGIRDMKHMKDRITALRDRVAALEKAQKAHLPYHAADEIENAIAAINRIAFDLDLKQEFVDNALEHLKAARGK